MSNSVDFNFITECTVYTQYTDAHTTAEVWKYSTYSDRQFVCIHPHAENNISVCSRVNTFTDTQVTLHPGDKRQELPAQLRQR